MHLTEIKHSRLAYGESYTEKAFLRYIKRVYSARNNLKVVVTCGMGGGPKSVLVSAVRFIKTHTFDSGFILLDTDGGLPEKEREDVLNLGYLIFPVKPCIEGFLMSILNPSSYDRYTNMPGDRCKYLFNKTYLSEKNALDPYSYDSLIPPQLLENSRNEIPLLNDLLNQFSSI